MALNPLVSLFGRPVARSGRISGRVSDQTSDTQKNSDGHSKKALRATNKAIIPVDSTLGAQTKYKISKV